MQRQDTYERTYSQQLPEVQRPSTEDDYAIACVLAENEREAHHVSEPPPDTSLDGQLALQLHDKESNKLLQSASQQQRKRSRAFRKLLRSLNVTRVIPRLNPGFFPDDSYVSQDRQRLLLRLDMYALQERSIVGDGNCQFRAIADQLYGTQDRHVEVRQQVVQQLCSHPERYRDYVTTDYEQYVSSMSQPGSWGDHVTLQAAADVFDTRICVLSSFLDNCVISIQPLQQDGQQQGQEQLEDELKEQRLPADTLWLAFWAEVHYNSLAAKAPASPSESEDDSSSSDETLNSGKKLLGSKKLRKAAEKLF